MNKKNYRLIFNLLLTLTAGILLSSCAREKASWSYHNEKLRKQSLEIENSIPASSLSEKPEEAANVSTEIVSENTPETAIEKNSITSPASEKKIEGKKLNPVQKMALKKLEKSLSPEKLEKINKSTALDQNLRYAIIFGVIGIALCILGWIVWPLYLLGVIAIVVGLVFLVLWIMEQ